MLIILKLYFDNQAVFQIASNSVFCEKNKYTKIVCDLVYKKVLIKKMIIVYVNHLNLVISMQISSWNLFMVLKAPLFVININITEYCIPALAWGIVLKNSLYEGNISL